MTSITNMVFVFLVQLVQMLSNAGLVCYNLTAICAHQGIEEEAVYQQLTSPQSLVCKIDQVVH